MNNTTRSREKVVESLKERAYHHWWVCTVAIASAAFVLVAAAYPAYLWLENPFRGTAANATSGALTAIAGARLFALAIVGYLVRLLSSMYRYNAQLWGHYSTRAWALELTTTAELSFEAAAAAMSTSTITFTADGPLMTIEPGKADKGD